jgi:hypothetical protein
MFGRFPGEEQGDAVKDILRTNNPSKRITDPLEIAELAVYLTPDDSAYVVGADFLIDSGVSAISAVGASKVAPMKKQHESLAAPNEQSCRLWRAPHVASSRRECLRRYAAFPRHVRLHPSR